MTKEGLLRLLDQIKDEISRDASMEGSLEYQWSSKPGELNVQAFIRTGNDQGQGSAMVVSDPREDMEV